MSSSTAFMNSSVSATEILKAVRKLPAREQRRLADRISRRAGRDDGDNRRNVKPARNGGNKRDDRRGIKIFLSMGGVAHSDYRDVSLDKYKHLSEVYGG